MNNTVLSKAERITLFEMMKSGMEKEDITLKDLPDNLKTLYLKLVGNPGDYYYDL